MKNLTTALPISPHTIDHAQFRPRLGSDPVSMTRPKSSTIQRALDQIKCPTPQAQQTSSPILSALARQTIADAVLPSATSAEPEKQIIKVHSSPAILAMAALPRNKSFLNNPTFQLGSGANARLASPIFRRNSNPGFSPLKVLFLLILNTLFNIAVSGSRVGIRNCKVFVVDSRLQLNFWLNLQT